MTRDQYQARSKELTDRWTQSATRVNAALEGVQKAAAAHKASMEALQGVVVELQQHLADAKAAGVLTPAEDLARIRARSSTPRTS